MQKGKKIESTNLPKLIKLGYKLLHENNQTALYYLSHLLNKMSTQSQEL